MLPVGPWQGLRLGMIFSCHAPICTQYIEDLRHVQHIVTVMQARRIYHTLPSSKQ